MYKKIFDIYKVTFTADNIHVENSFKCEKFKNIENIINQFRSDQNASKYMKRTNKSYAYEWAAHNLFYNLGLFKDRTAHVDLEYPQKWYMSIGYYIFGFIYKIFH